MELFHIYSFIRHSFVYELLLNVVLRCFHLRKFNAKVLENLSIRLGIFFIFTRQFHVAFKFLIAMQPCDKKLFI